jgi:hypothetical protein
MTQNLLERWSKGLGYLAVDEDVALAALPSVAAEPELATTPKRRE